MPTFTHFQAKKLDLNYSIGDKSSEEHKCLLLVVATSSWTTFDWDKSAAHKGKLKVREREQQHFYILI
jgi:hypothetical protein